MTGEFYNWFLGPYYVFRKAELPQTDSSEINHSTKDWLSIESKRRQHIFKVNSMPTQLQFVLFAIFVIVASIQSLNPFDQSSPRKIRKLINSANSANTSGIEIGKF